ncbi:MAG: NmrA family NAD(P)-binding protein [Longimonas sp.]|uniref:NmrA family NAD(P)-binding protein n=1 Tax=Longimonas sp. TaxID=2039626 RepID=UPI003361F586
MDTTVLVTGPTGNVGAPLVRILSEQGVSIQAGVHSGIGRLGEVPTVPLDFRKPETFVGALSGVEQVFLVRPPAISDIGNTLGPFIEQAEAMGVRHIVFLSLLGAEANPVVPHARVESSLMEADLDVTLLRASFFMQNLSTTHRREIRDRGEIIVPAGDGRTSFVDCRDLAAAAARALTDPSVTCRAYDCTGPAALSYHEVAAIMTDVLDRPIRYTNPSLLRFAWHAYQEGHPWIKIVVMGAIYTTARLGWAARVTDDLNRLLTRPPYTMREFVESHASSWA